MPTKFQLLMRFTKNGKARFLSHRELLNLIEQAIRRADIPIVFSEGYNPRPRISFPTALPLGISSDDEIMYFQLSEWVSQSEIAGKLDKKLIAGIDIKSIEPFRQDAIVSFSAEYKITPLKNEAADELSKLSPDKIKNWMCQPEQLMRRDYFNKESKTVDLKLYIRTIVLKDSCLFLGIKIANEGTIRPEEVLKSFDIKSTARDGSFSIHKLHTGV